MAKMMRGVKGARSLFLCYKRGDKTFESDIRTILENGSEGAGVQGSRVPGNIDAGRVFFAMPKRVWMDLAINSLLPNRDDQRFRVQTVGRRPVTCICRQPKAYRRLSRVQATTTKRAASCVLPNNMQPKTRPIQRLATAVSRCSVEVSMPTALWRMAAGVGLR